MCSCQLGPSRTRTSCRRLSPLSSKLLRNADVARGEEAAQRRQGPPRRRSQQVDPCRQGGIRARVRWHRRGAGVDQVGEVQPGRVLQALCPPDPDRAAYFQRRRLAPKLHCLRAAQGGLMDSWRPSAKQAEFLAAGEDEVLYGGAAGGGKSDALLIDALGLQQRAIANPNYRALIIRQTFPQLRKLFDRAHQLYPCVAPGAEFYERPWIEWRFPAGAKIIFGSCERDVDVHDFQGQEFQWIGIDELGHYSSPYVWEYLSSRLRTAD